MAIQHLLLVHDCTLLFFAMCMIVFLCNIQNSKLYIMLASILKMFKTVSFFFSFEKCYFCFLYKVQASKVFEKVSKFCNIQASKNFKSKYKIAFLLKCVSYRFLLPIAMCRLQVLLLEMGKIMMFKKTTFAS